MQEMNTEYQTNTRSENPVQFCMDIVLKEAREEDRLVKQITYTMISAYTNNPVNLAINSPSGEGKTYILQKVGEKFPKEDVMFLAGMTDKALFHRHGVLVIRNEQTGEYESLDETISDIDSRIEDKELEIARTKDPILKDGLKSFINALEEDKKDLKKRAKKLIDLSRKVLVFLDSPRPELFNAIMSLLSHDRYEVEYEFVDTNNGIKTKSNILRGWPAVIFVQAIDYSHYKRYPEIQRRFIITNPKMSAEKYSNAVDLICDKFGLPDFAYQAKVVNDIDKERVREIIKDIKRKMLEVCNRIEPGKNNVVIPFIDIIKTSLPKQRAFDMTTSNRFGGFLSLLPLVNFDKRPRLVVKKKGESNFLSYRIPFTLFEDLQETIFLMEYANGVRPYILEWYNDVFLELYNTKTCEDSRINSRGEVLTENRIAVTTKEMIDKTFELQKKRVSTQQVLQTFIKPLVNENFIDLIHSEIDKRARIYYPVSSTKNYNKLFASDEMNNFSQQPKMPVEDPALYPDKQYIISKIQEVLNYSSDNDLLIEIQNHEGKNISIEELASQYYAKPEDYFEQPTVDRIDSSGTKGSEIHNGQVITAIQKRSDGAIQCYSAKTTRLDEYHQDGQAANKYHETLNNSIKNVLSKQEEPKELFICAEMNNLPYSPIISIEEFFDNSKGESLPAHDLELSPCYPIIEKKKFETIDQALYLCKIHPEVWSIDIRGIEHHCKYQDPDKHKAEILKSLSITEGN